MRARGMDQRAWKTEGKKQQMRRTRRPTVVVREAVVDVLDGICLVCAGGVGLYEVMGIRSNP